MADLGMTMSRAEDKTDKMKAKAQALDEMIDSGVLTDYTSDEGGDMIKKELEKVSMSSVEEELAKLKAQRTKNTKKAISERQEGEVKEDRGEEQRVQA